MLASRHRVGVGVLVALLVGGAAGCDTLKARQRATRAAALYKEGDLEAAAALYEEAQKLDPGIPEIALDLGFTYLSLFNSAPKTAAGARWGTRAADQFRRYLALRPDDSRGRSYLIQTFVDTRNYADAEAFFRPEVEKSPPSVEAISILGQIAARVGRIDDALRWYERRAAVVPNDPDGHSGLGVLIWDHLHSHAEMTGDARIALADRGIASLKRAIELSPDVPEPYTYINLLHRERAIGHVCVVSDGGAAAIESMQPDGGLGGCAARIADVALADQFLKTALEKMKTRSVPAAPPPSGGKP